MSADKTVEYVCCGLGSYFWIAIGALLIVSGTTSLLYLSNFWTLAEIRFAGAFILVLLGILVITATVRPRR